MSNKISYNHPSLSLGTVIGTRVMAVLKQIGSAQNIIDVSQEKMNSLIRMKHSLTMTINELLDMNVDTSNIEQKIVSIDGLINEAANAYIANRIDNESEIQKLKEELIEIEHSDVIESPVDYQKSLLIDRPLASESLKLEAQYFSFDTDKQRNTLAKIESFIKESTEILRSESKEIAKKATSQIEQQRHQHSVIGTLIITASCTHKNVSLIEPCVLDPDRAVASWNRIHENDKIDVSKPQDLITNLNSTSTLEEAEINLLTGATYGSSFIGMVHVLKALEKNENISEEMIAKLNDKMRLGGWLSEVTGGVGVPKLVTDEVKAMLSTQKVSSHITVLTTGTVCSIASNKLKQGLNEFIKLKEDKNTETDEELATVDSLATKSKNQKRLIEIENLKNKSIIEGLQDTDNSTNLVMDVNSIMTAFDNYLSSINENKGITGVPIAYYTKKITKQKIIDLWVKKYKKQ